MSFRIFFSVWFFQSSPKQIHLWCQVAFDGLDSFQNRTNIPDLTNILVETLGLLHFENPNNIAKHTQTNISKNHQTYSYMKQTYTVYIYIHVYIHKDMYIYMFIYAYKIHVLSLKIAAVSSETFARWSQWSLWGLRLPLVTGGKTWSFCVRLVVAVGWPAISFFFLEGGSMEIISGLHHCLLFEGGGNGNWSCDVYHRKWKSRSYIVLGKL